MVAAYIKGIQSQGVYACPKHFAVNSQELCRMAMNSVLDERTLREIYLTGFEIAVKSRYRLQWDWLFGIHFKLFWHFVTAFTLK